MARYKSELGLTTPRFKRKEKELREVITKLQDALMKANESLNDPDRVMQSRNDVINREGLKFWSGIDSEKAERLYGNKSTDMEFGALPKDIEKMAITYRSFINAAGNATAKWSEDGKLGTDPGNAYRQGANDLRDSAATMYNGKYIGQFPKVNAGSNSNPTPVNSTFPSADAEPGSIDTEEGLIAAVKASEGDQEKLVNMINESKAWDAFKNDKGASKKFVADLKAAVRGVTVNKETANASALATVDGKVNQLNNKGIGPEAENENYNAEVIAKIENMVKNSIWSSKIKDKDSAITSFATFITSAKSFYADVENETKTSGSLDAMITNLGRFIAGGVLSDAEKDSAGGFSKAAVSYKNKLSKEFLNTGYVDTNVAKALISRAKGHITEVMKNVKTLRYELANAALGTKSKKSENDFYKDPDLTAIINNVNNYMGTSSISTGALDKLAQSDPDPVVEAVDLARMDKSVEGKDQAYISKLVERATAKYPKLDPNVAIYQTILEESGYDGATGSKLTKEIEKAWEQHKQ